MQYLFMPFVEIKCRNVLSVLLCNVCSNKFDVAYCFVLSRWYVLTDFISAINQVINSLQTFFLPW